jgi:hypothetical protein
MRYHELVEAKFRKPNIMFHGTSTAFLQSILKNGMVPRPKSKSWDVDPDVSMISQSKVSLEGSYWTSNLRIAISSAWRTAKKFKGDQLIIIAQIQQQQAHADEDSVTFVINDAFSNSFGGRVYQERPDLVAELYYDHPDRIQKIKEVFNEKLHNNLTKNTKKPIPTNMLNDLFDAFAMRLIAHGEKESGGKEWYSPLRRVTNKPDNVPSVNEAENNLLAQKDKVTRYYSESAIEQPNQYDHVLRITEPVTYNGANKILFVIERDKKLETVRGSLMLYYPLKLHYGTPPLPNKFMEQWYSLIGTFPGLITPDGKMLVEPSTKGQS